MIRRVLSILILFVIVIVSFAETMVWLLGTELKISNDYLNLGVFVLSLIALFILSGGRNKNENHKKIYIKDDKDSVQITENAITQMVRNAISKVTEVLSSDIAVRYTKDKKISLKISLVLVADSNITKATSSVEQNVRQVFTEILEDKVENIEVLIKGFKNSSTGTK